MFNSLLKDIGLWLFSSRKVNYHEKVAAKVDKIITSNYGIGLCYTQVLVAVYKGQYLHDIAEYNVADRTLKSSKTELGSKFGKFLPKRIYSHLPCTPTRTVTLHLIGIFSDSHARCIGYLRSGDTSTFSKDRSPFIQYISTEHPLFPHVAKYNKTLDHTS